MSGQPTTNVSPFPSAPVVDLDLEPEQDEQTRERRVMRLAAERIQSARTRFEHLGIVDAHGALVSDVLPSDIASDSESTLDTG